MLLSGRAPFNGPTDNAILQKVVKGVYEMNPRHWGHISKEARDLVTKMLEMDIEKRLTAAETLKHPWFEAMAKLKDEDIKPQAFNEALQSLKSYRVRNCDYQRNFIINVDIRLEENCSKHCGSSLCSNSLVRKNMRDYSRSLRNSTRMVMERLL